MWTASHLFRGKGSRWEFIIIIKYWFAEVFPIEVSMRFSEVDLNDTCGGENLTMCEEVILQEILYVSGLERHMISNLQLTPGTCICWICRFCHQYISSCGLLSKIYLLVLPLLLIRIERVRLCKLTIFNFENRICRM